MIQGIALALLVLAGSLQTSAAVIISLEPATGFTNFIGSHLMGEWGRVRQVGTAAFSIAHSYSSVKIEAVITGWPSTLDAYLTDQIGAGTTIGNELAAGQVVAPGPSGHIGYPRGFTTIFTGLNLAPGTYYLTLTSDTENGNWYDRVFPILTEAPGAHHLGTYSNVTGYGLYPPAHVLPNLYNPPGGLLYRVSGDQVAVPEPAVWLTLASGMIALGWFRRPNSPREHQPGHSGPQ